MMCVFYIKLYCVKLTGQHWNHFVKLVAIIKNKHEICVPTLAVAAVVAVVAALVGLLGLAF